MPPAGNEVKEETYEKTNFELFYGAGPVPDSSAHGGAGAANGARQRQARHADATKLWVDGGTLKKGGEEWAD